MCLPPCLLGTCVDPGAAQGGACLCRQVIAASDIPAGKEIENTYGELGNADLVNKYGFALRQNPFSVVQLDKATVVEAARQHC